SIAADRCWGLAQARHALRSLEEREDVPPLPDPRLGPSHPALRACLANDGASCPRPSTPPSSQPDSPSTVPPCFEGCHDWGTPRGASASTITSLAGTWEGFDVV